MSLNNWSFMRLLRLLIGAYALVEAYRTAEWILLLPAGILLLQAGFNVGCMGGACAPNTQRNTDVQAVDDVQVHVEEY